MSSLLNYSYWINGNLAQWGRLGSIAMNAASAMLSASLGGGSPRITPMAKGGGSADEINVYVSVTKMSLHAEADQMLFVLEIGSTRFTCPRHALNPNM